MKQRLVLHFIDPSTRIRAELSRIGFELGHHAEVYGDVDELIEHTPRSGIIIARDDPAVGGVVATLDRLSQAGVWLPLLATDHDPDTARTVAAIKAGALDYLALPIERDAFARTLARMSEEARAHGEARRRMIEARDRIEALSNRERQVLDWLAEGSSNKAIARELEISPRTVEIHRANMMTKLGAKHSAEAVRLRIEAQMA